jgi:hypothetical protein
MCVCIVLNIRNCRVRYHIAVKLCRVETGQANKVIIGDYGKNEMGIINSRINEFRGSDDQ